MKLAVLIVNFRTPDLTAACLSSLVNELEAIGDAHAYVVENGSGDDSYERLRQAIDEKKWNDLVTLIRSETNRGFAGGINLAYSHATAADFILLLNSDTVVGGGCFAHCLNVMQHEATIGALSCLLRNADGSPQNTARKFPTPWREFFNATGLSYVLPWLFGWAITEDTGWNRETVCRDVEWIGGGFMLCRGDMVRRIGLLDEDFFFYGEDIEFCCRIHRAGFRVRYDPRVSITHLGAASSDPERMVPARRARARWEARYLAMRKCHGRFAEWVIRRIDRLAWEMRRCQLILTGRRGSEAHRQAAAVCALLSARPANR